MKEGALVSVVFLFGMLCGWIFFGSIDDCEEIHKELFQIIEQDKKVNVAHAIRTLEISLRGDDEIFIAQALEHAKLFSGIANGYGKEKIAELEAKIR